MTAPGMLPKPPMTLTTKPLAQAPSHGRFGEEYGRHQQAGNAGKYRTEREGHRDGAVDGNADQARGVQILCGSLHQDAEPRFCKQQKLQQQDYRKCHENENLVHGNDDAGKS